MKTRLQKLALMVLVLILAGCSKKSSDNTNSIMPNQEVMQSFNKSYPEAKMIWWKRYQSYDVANFDLASQKHVVWYQTTGIEVMKESILTLSSIPVAVKNAFNSSSYTGSKVDWVKELNMQGVQTQYVIGASKSSESNTLYYTSEGLFLRAVKGDNEALTPQIIPSKVDEYVKTTYPTAKVIDADVELNTVSVSLMDNNNRIDVHFDDSYNLMYTSTNASIVFVPAVVLDAVRSNYDNYIIAGIKKLVYTDGSINYLFDMQSHLNQVVTAVFNEAGDKVS